MGLCVLISEDWYKGYFVVTPEDCCSTMNAEWHNASINYAMQNVAVVTNADAVIRALG